MSDLYCPKRLWEVWVNNAGFGFIGWGMLHPFGMSWAWLGVLLGICLGWLTNIFWYVRAIKGAMAP